MLLHCLYLHLFREDQEDRRLWNLACDIAVEQIISREKIEKLYENEWFGEQELEVFLKLAEEWRRPAALMGLLHLKKANYGFKEKKFEL